MSAVSAQLTMDQLAIVKETECLQLVEQNYDYNLLTKNEESTDEPDIEEMRQILAGQAPDKSESAIISETNKGTPDFISKLPADTDGYQLYDSISYTRENNIRGQNIKIALFDTGIAEHSDYTVSGGVSYVGDTTTYTDTDGHGTQMAGIIAASGEINPNVRGAAPEAELYAVKLVETEGESFVTTASILMGIGWSIENEIDIINMSFGTYFESKLLQQAINLASANNILLVGAVGNDGGFADEYRIMYPAAYENVIAVGAGGAYGTESFSSNNEKLDFVAPGRLQSTMFSDTYTDAVGTSVSAAYVTGLLAGLWSFDTSLSNNTVLNIAKNAAVVSANQKDYIGFGTIDLKSAIENRENYAILEVDKVSKNNTAVFQAVTEMEIAERSQMEADMPMAMAASNCFANEMASAISIGFINWKSGRINCPYNEVWYKFTANASGVHPNGSPGKYTVHTQGSLDTVGYLYDSSGNQIAYSDDDGGGLNFNFWASCNYYQTYYIRVRAWSSNTGNYDIRVSYFDDDYGNTIDSAYMGSELWGSYFADKSITGELHSEGDVDYFGFVPARDCVMKIYTTGSTDTYGMLYDECKNKIREDDDEGGNGQFLIYKEVKAMQYYYIAVRHYSSSGYGNYSLKLKFIRDYSKAPSSLGVSSVIWHNESYVTPRSSWLGGPITCVKNLYFVNSNATTKWKNNFLAKAEFSTALRSATSTVKKYFAMVDYGISDKSKSFDEIGIDILAGIVISYIEPFLDRLFYDAEVKKMSNNSYNTLKIKQYNYYEVAEGSVQSATEFSSGNYGNVYGVDYYRGIFSDLRF